MDASAISQENTFNFIVRSPRSPRSAKKHHRGSLPLYMFLSMDERNALANCPNASNPYHKCTGACIKKMKEGTKPVVIEEIPNRDHAGNLDSSTQSSDMRNVHPKCPNRSNPFHTTCSETCMQNINNIDRKQLEEKVSVIVSNKEGIKIRTSTAKDRGEKTIPCDKARNVQPICPNGSNPYHTICTEACMQKINNMSKSYAKEKISVLAVSSNNEGIPQCKYASNPYHRCAETCIQRTNGGKRKGKGEISVVVEGINKGKNLNMEANDTNPENSAASDTKNLKLRRDSIDRTNEGQKPSEEIVTGLLISAVEKEETDTEEVKGGSEGNSDATEKIIEMLERSYDRCINASDSAHKCAVDDSFIEEYQPREGRSEEKADCLYPSDVLHTSPEHCFRELTTYDRTKGGVSGLQVQAAENCFIKIDMQTYIMLYLAIILTVIIAAGSK